jgi:hypothetical protein
MPRADRAFRATAHYNDGQEVTRRFLTKRARDTWAAGRLAGFPEEPDLSGSPYDRRPALEPASHVTVTETERLVWKPEVRHGA